MPALSPIKPAPVLRSRLSNASSAPLVRGLSVVALAVVLAACGKSAPPQAAAPGGGMPAPEVGVITVAPGDVGLVTELPGRLEASRVAQVRARAAGRCCRGRTGCAAQCVWQCAALINACG